ncbi:zinc finger MYM-type protein 1-like [Homalodisca vitripennis]|uniref:zinc finger MYM-type protein 1-like n=1 Tax=Homalodisca vitripennis TaxID=197043 RepID=UPI001EEC12BE|nr:zinc finger MYM-type protein 1-like [Homalodisca vitripennis]
MSHVDQLVLAVGYVLNDGVPCERFLTFIPSVGHTAEGMFKSVMRELGNLEINIDDCRGQSYDNASNMSGTYNGLQAKIKSKSPLALFIPCAAHSLNLVGSSAAESCEEACRFFMLLQELYVFFTSSTKRWECLIGVMEDSYQNNKTIKRVCPTRWSARDDACQSLRESWDEVYKALTTISKDPTGKATTRCEAQGIARNLERFETAFMIHRLTPVLACSDRMLRVLDHSTLLHSLSLTGVPTVLHLSNNDGGAIGDQLLYSTDDGTTGLVQITKDILEMVDGAKQAWQCLYCYAITGDGMADLLWNVQIALFAKSKI